jgi:hypothetical protein
MKAILAIVNEALAEAKREMISRNQSAEKVAVPLFASAKMKARTL